MNLSEVSIKNPVFAWMFRLALMIFGLSRFLQKVSADLWLRGGVR